MGAKTKNDDFCSMVDYTQMAIAMAGGTAALAKWITSEGQPITTQAISQWLLVPPSRVLLVEQATGGQITRHRLRPDVFGV
jgi:DNA-binding transcriptional regulator YdaS (Cro superfamily)